MSDMAEREDIMSKLIKYTQEEIDRIPFYMKDRWREDWMKEQNKSQEYLGRLAILIQGKKLGESHWITEGIDFEIVR